MRHHVSGHAFSPDGLTWAVSPDPPYGAVVDFTDGTSVVVPTRERPKLIFGADGNPTHLVNGVAGGAQSCAPFWCSHCKILMWDYTLVQPLAVV